MHPCMKVICMWSVYALVYACVGNITQRLHTRIHGHTKVDLTVHTKQHYINRSHAGFDVNCRLEQKRIQTHMV
jgi:hypothetical protein